MFSLVLSITLLSGISLLFFNKSPRSHKSYAGSSISARYTMPIRRFRSFSISSLIFRPFYSSILLFTLAIVLIQWSFIRITGNQNASCHKSLVQAVIWNILLTCSLLLSCFVQSILPKASFKNINKILVPFVLIILQRHPVHIDQKQNF